MKSRSPTSIASGGSPALATTRSNTGSPAAPVLTLACDNVLASLRTDDQAAAHWLQEFLYPWFTPARNGAGWQVSLSSSPAAYLEATRRQPAEAQPCGCFVFDRQVLSLPAWPVDGGTRISDAERSCVLTVSPSRILLTGDPRTRRWRMTLLWTFCEIAAIRLRRTRLDLHAAAIEQDGRGIAICGPKGSAKTTLVLHLLQSGAGRLIANDRIFVGGAGAGFRIRGMPTAVKIRPDTLADFPSLRQDLPLVRRPYLYSLQEWSDSPPHDTEPGDADYFALSPAQFTRQLRASSAAEAPLGALVFPRVDTGLTGWRVERLPPEAVGAALRENPYGQPRANRRPTIFEELDGRPSLPSRDLADAIAKVIPGYGLVLGPDAYGQADFALRLLEKLMKS